MIVPPRIGVNIAYNVALGKGGKGERGDEIARRLGHQYLYFGAIFYQQAREVGCFIGCNGAGYTKDNPHEKWGSGLNVWLNVNGGIGYGRCGYTL